MIEGVIRNSLTHRVIVLVIACTLLIAGILSIKSLSVDAFPDVTNVQVQVATEAPGRPPTEVERFITVPIEIAMTGLPGLTEMRSLNRNGISVVTMVFSDQTNINVARQMVLERLIEASSSVPAGVTPVLGPVSTGLGEIFQYTLEHPLDKLPDGRLKTLSQAELTERRTVQDWVVRPMLRGVAGIAEINSQGGFVKQYQVRVNPDRLRYFALNVKDVFGALARNNANSSGGVMPAYAEQYLIRGTGLIGSSDDIGNIMLKEVRSTPVYLRDVAEVVVGSEVRQGAIIKNGDTEAVAGIVQMLRGANAREVVTRLKEKVDEINRKNLLPGGLQIVAFYDRSELVNAALSTVAKVLLEGVILVVVVLFVFLGDVRSSLIVVVTLILTPLLTFLVMNRIGLSANLMSLGGLAIAIGLMVDGSVVVVENTFSKLGKLQGSGQSKLEIVSLAAAEVGKPVLFGIGIIILVFLPLLTLTGMEGKMFGPLALTIAIALGISLILSFTLSPVLCGYILKGGEEHDTWLLAAMKRPYLAALRGSLKYSKKVLIGAVLLFLGSIAVLPLLGTAFIPTMKEGSITPVLIRVPKISLEESVKMEFRAMKAISEVPGVSSVVSRLGRGESATDPGQPNESDPIVNLKPRKDWPKNWDQDDIGDAIRASLKSFPGVELSISQPIEARVDEMVSGVRSQVAIKLFGDELETLKEQGEQIARILSSVRGATDLRVERVSGQEYLTIAINRTAIARYGLNVEDVNDLIEIAVKGRDATLVYEGERRFAATVRFPLEYRNSIEAISNITLRAPSGAVVPLRDVAEIKLADGPAQVSRENAKRRLVIGTNVKGRDLGGFVAEAQARISKELNLPQGYELVWGGQFENMQRAMERLMIIVPITILAIFFLLFVLFDSIRFALLIITVLPLASIGGIIGLWFSGEYLSVPAAVGFINLWGIAVLNGVVLVSYIRQQRDSGMSSIQAIVEGCTHRFRPVIMTASVALLALIPMLFSSGPGSEVTRPLAVVVIGGLVSSTTLTLILLPVLYRWFEPQAQLTSFNASPINAHAAST
jgi:heavy metal efflux system protein